MNRAKTVEMFSSLGCKLSEGIPREVVETAVEENPWLSTDDIDYAVGALCQEMLRPKKLSAWLARYPLLPAAKPSRVAVVMAGNIPLVGFYDLLCTVCAGHTALVKPSSKDRVLVDYIIGLLVTKRIKYLTNDDCPDAALVTGGSDAVRHFAAKWPDRPLLLRAHRSSVAVLDGSESDDELLLLADDCFRYNGLGCRNVSLLLIPRTMNAVRLATVLGRYPHFGRRFTEACRPQRALLTMQGGEFIDGGSFVLTENSAFSECINRLNIMRYDSLNEVDLYLARHDRELQCVVGTAVEHPRRVGFGRAQHPTLLDPPDGLDPMEFLARLTK